MSAHLVRGLRRAVALAALWASMVSAWAQSEQIMSRIEGLEPIQQRLLQALIESRQIQDGARLFTDEEVRAVRSTVPYTETPLSRVDIEKLTLRIRNVFGPRDSLPYRIVNHDPVFPVCPGCDDRLDRTCHDSLSQSRRIGASRLLTQGPHLTEAVGGLYLVRADGLSQLIGTVFVLQGRIVTNVHVMLDATQPAGPINVRKLRPELRVEAVFGGGNVRRMALPADAQWHRHPTLDLIQTAWPAGVAAPVGLTLATGLPVANTPVALMGFPSVNTNTDRQEDIERVFGRCPNAQASEPRMMISMGRIASVSDTALEHDANTMGNSSGSPLIRMVDGALVGVHRGDTMSSVRNSAVVASALAELMTAELP